MTPADPDWADVGDDSDGEQDLTDRNGELQRPRRGDERPQGDLFRAVQHRRPERVRARSAAAITSSGRGVR